MKKIFFILLVFLYSFFIIVKAITFNLSSGEVLSSSSWQEISNITDKTNLFANDLNISGKLVSSGKICAGSSCLGECDSGKVWDDSSASCLVPAQTQETAGISCKTIREQGINTDGTYWVDPNGGSTSDAFQVYCDMTTDDGGWTLIATPKGTWVSNGGAPNYVYPLTISSGSKSALQGTKTDLIVTNSEKIFRVVFSDAKKIFIKESSPVRDGGIAGSLYYGYFAAYWGSNGSGSCTKTYENVLSNSWSSMAKSVSCGGGKIYGSHSCGGTNGWILLYNGLITYNFSGHPCAHVSPYSSRAYYIWVR